MKKNVCCTDIIFLVVFIAFWAGMVRTNIYQSTPLLQWVWLPHNSKDRKVFQLNASWAKLSYKIKKHQQVTSGHKDLHTVFYTFLHFQFENKIIIEHATILNSFPGFNEIQSAIHIQGQQKTFLLSFDQCKCTLSVTDVHVFLQIPVMINLEIFWKWRENRHSVDVTPVFKMFQFDYLLILGYSRLIEKYGNEIVNRQFNLGGSSLLNHLRE